VVPPVLFTCQGQRPRLSPSFIPAPGSCYRSYPRGGGLGLRNIVEPRVVIEEADVAEGASGADLERARLAHS